MVKIERLYLVALPVLIVGLSFGPALGAPYLACDPPEAGVNIISTEIEVNRVSTGAVSVVAGLSTLRGKDFLLLDLGGMAADLYKFKARWKNEAGWWSAWSPFFDAGPTGPVGGLRVVP